MLIDLFHHNLRVAESMIWNELSYRNSSSYRFNSIASVCATSLILCKLSAIAQGILHVHWRDVEVEFINALTPDRRIT